ncbi:MAG: ATP-binding cassette domain-containing protein [Phycisphaera sp.]|nr:ATP-binding cassette domain-containing protein [Phycisphaera sp.]
MMASTTSANTERAQGSALAAGAPLGVRARGLVKRFGAVTAVRGIDLALPSRGVCGLLGPNGAGKTTTIRMIAGILEPDEGVLEVAGLDARRAGATVRSRIGYLPESAPLSPELTVLEHMRFRAGLAGLSGARARAAIDECMRRCDVARFAHRCAGTLSKGMQQRVGLAAAILGDPALVILDEPSVGLDPGQTLVFRTLVRELGQSRLVLFSSHLLSEVESVCGELAVIAGGRLVVHETLEAFRARASEGSSFVVETDAPPAGVAARALADGWWRSELALADDAARAEAVRALAARGLRVRRAGAEVRSLESVFVELVHDAARRDGDAPHGAGGGA